MKRMNSTEKLNTIHWLLMLMARGISVGHRQMMMAAASASEVLAAALADNHRARIIGSRTFGKGSVQSVLPLDNGDSIKLTTARYYTPNGRSIQAVGIAPDIVLKPQGEPLDAGNYREAGLSGHLQGEDEQEQQPGGDFLPGPRPIEQALQALKDLGSPADTSAAAGD